MARANPDPDSAMELPQAESPGCLQTYLVGIRVGVNRIDQPADRELLPDVDIAPDFTQLQLRFVDQLQWRYELIHPLVLFKDRPTPPPAIQQRAHETAVAYLGAADNVSRLLPSHL